MTPHAGDAEPPNPRASVRPARICKIWDGEYPWDVRAEKVCTALTAHGWQVDMAARNRHGRPTLERLPEATVHRFSALSWAPKWLNDGSTFPAFFNPRWFRLISQIARETHTDLILCRDLPLAIPSILVARHLGVPVVLDMAENYPAMLRSRHDTGHAKITDLLVRNPALAQMVEDWVLPRLDGVLVVVEESRDRLVKAGVDASRIAVVGNTPPLHRLDDSAAPADDRQPLRLVYLGLLELQRGLPTVLDAVAQLRRDNFPVTLDVFGNGIDEDAVHQQAETLGLTPPTITFHGWVKNEIALASLRSAHIGLIPHRKDDSWNTTIPNKLFDYMAAGLPVISSDAIPAARVVRSTGAGRVYRDPDAGSLANEIRALAPAEARRAAAAAGRAAIRSTYHWEKDVARLIELLKGVREGPLSTR